jgi:1-acyl-sn-glycerol-3-phosphate acyltransferase
MKRSEKGPNTFSQTIKDLEPGRLYSLKMFVCDYNDLITPKSKKVDEAKSFSTVLIEGADVDVTRSFAEVYASEPEPKIPVCITYHWKVFRARTSKATLTVSDGDTAPFGQEQAFNFLEIQPYHE